MAYLLDTDRRCTSCDKRATKELRNTRNEKMAVYCAACAKRALAKLQASEDGKS